jgi:hypothetical protein
MSAQTLLAHLAEITGVDRLQFDHDGDAAFSFEGGATVQLKNLPDQDAMIMFCNLGPIAIETAAATQRMLAANLFWQGTGGSTLGITAAGDVVLAERLNVASTNPAGFIAAVERLADYADDWQTYLRGGHEVATPAVGRSPAGSQFA